jgi:ATP-dependent Clp protease adaptor protein ClpS
MKTGNHSAEQTLEVVETDLLTTLNTSYNLIVWNDNVNTFDWVIETLIEVCGHTPEQAEQCAFIIHYHGKYAVKQGDYETLKPMCEAILDRGINATIEELLKNNPSSYLLLSLQCPYQFLMINYGFRLVLILLKTGCWL